VKTVRIEKIKAGFGKSVKLTGTHVIVFFLITVLIYNKIRSI